MVHGDALVIPYAISDSYCGVATVTLSELLERMRPRALGAPTP